MELIEYLQGQIYRMNADQRSLVDRVAALPAGAHIQKLEEERLSQLYLWLHMDSGSVSHRFWRAQVVKPNSPKKRSKAQRKRDKKAAKAPRWVRDIAAAKFDPHGERRHQDSKLGTLGAASEVRRIDPAEYLAAKEKSET